MTVDMEPTTVPDGTPPVKLLFDSDILAIVCDGADADWPPTVLKTKNPDKVGKRSTARRTIRTLVQVIHLHP